jgi:hypothetical protein
LGEEKYYQFLLGFRKDKARRGDAMRISRAETYAARPSEQPTLDKRQLDGERELENHLTASRTAIFKYREEF